MGAPAFFHHGPVGFIAIHGNLHTATAGSNGIISALGAQLCQHVLQLGNILQGRGSGHVTAIQQDVAVGLHHALCPCFLQHGNQVGDVGVNVAVGQQTQEMQGVTVLCVGNQVLPGLGLEHGTAFDALLHQLCTLRINLTAAQGIVADLRVAHVVIGGQTNGSAVRLQPGVGAGSQQLVQGGGFCNGHSIAAAAVTLAHAVHNYKYNGFFHDDNLQSEFFA